MAKLLQSKTGSRSLGAERRAWWAMRRQKRRRHARAAAPVPVVPAPTDLYVWPDVDSMYMEWGIPEGTVVDGYAVECRLVQEPPGPWTEAGRTGPDELSYSMSVTHGGLWEFRVRALCGSTYSEYSSVASAHTVPTAPGVEVVTGITEGVQVEWSYSGLEMDGFKLYWQPPGESAPVLAGTAGPQDRASVLPVGLVEATYQFWVTACVGELEVWSEAYTYTV